MKIISTFCLFILFASCKKPETLAVRDIPIPKYYKHYIARPFWESKGADYTFSPTIKNDTCNYKDATSTNFFNLGEMHTNILDLSEKDRKEMYKSDMDAYPLVINKDYEIYKSEGVETFFKPPLFRTHMTFLIKRDSVCFGIGYESFDKNPEKLRDYNTIANMLVKKCKDGTRFTSTLKRMPPETWIAN